MPRLLRGVARTAVIAGTATAVSNRVSRRQAGRWATQDEEAAPQPATVPAQPAPAAGPDLDKLKELGELRDQGVLTEAEFQQQKARLLSS